MSRLNVRVAKRRDEAIDIVSLELRALDSADLPAFSPGAHIDVHLKTGLVRQYSLCNHPADRSHYLIAVLREPNSRGGSVAVHETFLLGEKVEISEPKNHFALIQGERALLLAGGIGVTPLLCMAEQLWHSGTHFVMHYCNRNAARAAFRERISGAAYAHRVHFHHDDGADSQKLQLVKVLRESPPDTHVYVCGPAGFIDHVVATTKAEGWPEGRIHLEYFAAAPSEAANSTDCAFDVRVASTGQVIRVAADEPVTTALARHGIQVPMACQQGVCGTCVTRVLEGEPDHRDCYFTTQEKAKNDQFTPCCSRGHGLLILDL